MLDLARYLVVLAGVGSALACAAAPALGDARAELELGFTTEAPGAPAGVRIVIDYKNPDDPAAKPPALTGARIDLPAGTRIDNDAVPKCRASDAEIRSRGRDACPPETLVGTGRLVAITGFGPPADPVDGEVVAFNGEREIVEVVLVRGTDQAAGFDRIGIEGSRLTPHPPATPGGPPDGRTAIKRIELDLAAPSAGARPYVTTPPACPADRLWRSSASFTFGDGGATTVGAAAPCRPAAEPGLALRVAPATVRRGRRAALRVRVTSPGATCVRGAAIRLGRARATTDSRGRAVLRKFLSGARTVTVRASKPGCGRASAKVRVR
ncbi:MAG TPA: hypothetical protein VF715_13040 [Thermoleophilaceae bacterium]|jgi:hypothetical protein